MMQRNLFPYEHFIRMTLGIALIIYGIYYSFFILAFLGAIFIYTGGYRTCPMYRALGINSKEANEKFYLSLLPEYNPEPVFVFNRQGEAVFKNSNVSQEFIDEISQEFIQDAFLNNKDFISKIVLNKKTYIAHFKVAKEHQLIFGFAFDITKTIDLQQEIIKTQKEIVYKMGEIGESRSSETGNHVKRVAEYSYLLARLYGMTEEEAQTLKIASPMHDIGKVAIPDSVLKKPGKLDASEWEVMKTHASIGYELLKVSQRPILKAAAIVAKEHHEKYDGSGYPLGLKEEKIHIYGRITAIADVFDALGSERVYKKAWEFDKILEFFKEQTGTHFDPKLIKLFFDNIDEFTSIRDRFKD